MVFIWPVMLSHQMAFTQVLILSPCFTHLLLLVPHPSHCAAVSLSDVWELSFILRAVINACKWICGAVFSHKLWLKGCLNNSLVIFWCRAIIVKRLYMIMRSILRKQQGLVYDKMLKIKWVLNSTISQVNNKTWQHADENIVTNQPGLRAKMPTKWPEKSYPYWILIYGNSLLMGLVHLHLTISEGCECWLMDSRIVMWVRTIKVH